jgi:hypothetical protein
MNFANEVKQCGVCDRWTSDGDAMPSGYRNPTTGETLCANFVCRPCQLEARQLAEVHRALVQHAQRRAA